MTTCHQSYHSTLLYSTQEGGGPRCGGHGGIQGPGAGPLSPLSIRWEVVDPKSGIASRAVLRFGELRASFQPVRVKRRVTLAPCG